MPNHTVLRELSTAVHSSDPSSGHPGSRFHRFAPGVPRYRRAFFQIRKRPEFPAQVPAFFGRNARNRLISRRGDFKKRKRRKKMDERRRASGRTDERRQRWKLLRRKKKRKKKKRATVGVRVYSLLRTIRTLRGSANVVLVPPGHWLVPKRTE